MLTILRSAAGTWLAKLLLLLLVVSFGAWGISAEMMTGNTDNDVITAGSTKVTQSDFRLAYDRQLSEYSQQIGMRVSREQAKAFGVEDQITTQLVAAALLDEHARKMGLGVSEDRIAQLTAEDTAFHNANGQFDRQQFLYILNQVGMRPEDYLRNREQLAIRQQIVAAVSDGIAVPDTFLKAAALYRGEDRTVDFITLPQSIVQPVPAPQSTDLQTYFDANKSRYAAPEYRKISYVRLEPADIADAASISDEDVAADYEKNKNLYTTPERRKLEQLVFANADDAKAAVESLREGATFESIVSAQRKSIEDIQLGTLARSDISDPAVAEAAFGLEANQVSDVVNGMFGPVLVRVTQIDRQVVRPLTEVGEQIRRDLALGEASRLLIQVHDNFEDARGGGATLAEAAKQAGLKVTTIDAIDRQAKRPDGTIVDDIPASATVLVSAFESDIGVDNPSIQTDSNGYVFFDVEAITPARDRTLAEVRAEVTEDWTDDETTRLLAAKAEELQKRVTDGTSLADIAKELSLDKQTRRGLKRGADDTDFGREGVAAVFSVPAGTTKVTASPQDGAQIVFTVTDITEPAGADAASVDDTQRRQFGAGLADDLLDQLIIRLQAETRPTVNRAAIERVLSM